RIGWRDGDYGLVSVAVSGAFLLAPIVIGILWWPTTQSNIALAVSAGGILIWQIARAIYEGVEFNAPASTEGLGSAAMLAAALMVLIFVLLGTGKVLFNLPAMAGNGLSPPGWISDYDWAKPSLMIVGFWAAVGANNMLLYLAALTNVPGSLYEAADIDGASRFAKFWNVTWPQLAPTTFFIVIMSMIQAVQGGFEMAKTTTEGGPAGSTTTLAYYIYNQGFVTGRLGYS